MQKTKQMTSVELHDAGIRALIDRLGVSGMQRFIGLYYNGEGDFTRERHKKPQESLEKIAARVKKLDAARKRKTSTRATKK